MTGKMLNMSDRDPNYEYYVGHYTDIQATRRWIMRVTADGWELVRIERVPWKVDNFWKALFLPLLWIGEKYWGWAKGEHIVTYRRRKT